MDAHFCVICGPLGGVDAVLNVLLFIPLGAGLVLSGVPWRRAVLTACLLSIAVETTQLFFIPGRDATLGDVITNTVGASLGVALVRHSRTWLLPSPRAAAWLVLGWSGIWLTIQVISSFAFAPSIPTSRFYGEIAPKLGNFDVFRGRVLRATIDGVTIADTLLSDGDSLARRLRNAGQAVATVVPADTTFGIAPILRVADTSLREIVLLAQNEREFLFAVRTGAATLRLRGPLFGLPRAFPARGGRDAQQAADTVTLTGRYQARKLSLRAESSAGRGHSAIPIIASLGWTLLLPAQWFIQGTIGERILSWIWVAFLLLPLGYWTVYAARRSESLTRPSQLTWTISLVFVVAGLGGAPFVFGQSPTPASDWLAAFAGLTLGAVLARTTGSRPRLGLSKARL
jgi:hypothetical protein